MKTFLIRNGDFVIGQGGYVSLEGPAKVKQDLAVAVREPYGCDRFHPRWGTLLQEYVGRLVGSESEMMIRAEITRLVQNYIYAQGMVMERDSMNGRRSQFLTGELIDRMESLDVLQDYDRYRVRVLIRTLSGQQISVTRTVS